MMQAENISKVKRFMLMAFVAIVSISAGLWLSQKLLIKNNDHSIPPKLDATVLPDARLLKEFTLTQHDGQVFNPEQLKGHWSFLFFGFTNCPDVCPTVLKTMQQTWKTLPTSENEKGHPKLYFISVDPDRDKLNTLKKYVEYFNPEFKGVTGNLDELDKLTRQIGILYGYDDKDEGDDDVEYTVNHSAQIILIDPKARMRAVISPPHEAKIIAANFQTIRLFYGD